VSVLVTRLALTAHAPRSMPSILAVIDTAPLWGRIPSMISSLTNSSWRPRGPIAWKWRPESRTRAEYGRRPSPESNENVVINACGASASAEAAARFDVCAAAAALGDPGSPVEVAAMGSPDGRPSGVVPRLRVRIVRSLRWLTITRTATANSYDRERHIRLPRGGGPRGSPCGPSDGPQAMRHHGAELASTDASAGRVQCRLGAELKKTGGVVAQS
jgi:hypothetical protein